MGSFAEVQDAVRRSEAATEARRQKEAHSARQRLQDKIQRKEDKNWRLREECRERNEKIAQQKVLNKVGALVTLASDLNKSQKYPRCYCVYFIHQEGFYKIGYSVDLLSRMGSIRTSTPFEVRVEHAILCDSERMAASLESDLHNQFSEKRQRGEWFRLSKSELKSIVSDFKSTIVTYTHD